MSRVCVLGASGHLGRAVVLALVDRGHEVIGTYLTRPVAGGRCVDLRTDEGLAAIVALAPDVVIHAAAPPWPCGWDEPWAIGPRAAGRLVEGLLPAWTARGGGHLLLTAGLAVSHALEVPAPLAAAHGALPALARALSQHHGHCGVRVNVVAFGDLSGGHGSALPDAAARRADLERHAATRSRSTAAEAARFVAWAAFAPHLSGAVLSLHGGL